MSEPPARAKSTARRGWAWFGKALSRLVVFAAYAYPICLISLVLLFVYVGEYWWPSSVALYIPRYLFLAPLPVLSIGLLLLRRPKLLRTQLAAAIIVVFPLMGFVPPWPAPSRSEGPVLRVLSFNVDSGRAGYEKVVAQIQAYSPDVVLIQEAQFGNDTLTDILRRHYPHVQGATQFAIASKFRILSTAEPARLSHLGRQRSPRSIRHTLETPLGRVAFVNAHPLSPRGMLNVYRLRALPYEVKSGQLFSTDIEAEVEDNARLRTLQVEALAKLAESQPDPVVIAGDLNLPPLSAAFHRHLSEYQDAFREAGWGFGHTFASKYMPLRIDRVLTGPEFRIVAFQSGCEDLSDHLCIVADLQRR